MLKCYYYLHTGGNLIHKNPAVVDADTPEIYFESDFVVKWWCLDLHDRIATLEFLIEAKNLGASKKRTDELCKSWLIHESEFLRYAIANRIDLFIDFEQKWVASPNSGKQIIETGATAFEALCNYYNRENRVKTISVEPNWERVWAYFMHIKKTDREIFDRVTGELGEDWDKMVAMAERNDWKVE